MRCFFFQVNEPSTELNFELEDRPYVIEDFRKWAENEIKTLLKLRKLIIKKWMIIISK